MDHPADQSHMDGTPLNMTELLVTVLALVATFMIVRKKYDSNLPLLFYFVALVFTNLTDREVNPYLLYSGLAFALLLRFEFMNDRFVGFVKTLEIVVLGAIIYLGVKMLLV